MSTADFNDPTPNFDGQGNFTFPLSSPTMDPYKGSVTFAAFQDSYSNISQQALDTLAQRSTGTTATTGPEGASDESITGQDPSLQTVTTGRSARTSYGHVTLFLPQSILFSDAVNYGEQDLGIIGTGVYNAIRENKSIGDMARMMADDFSGTVSSLGDALRRGMNDAGPAAQVAALRVSRRISSEVAGAISGSTGIALNPNKRSILESVPIRKFQFSFKLIPTHEGESRQIKYITSWLRYHMYPEQVSAGGIALKFPSKFDISLTYDGKPVTTKILPCWLESVTTTYNGSSMAMHDDGQFQEIDIVLGFREERALTKEDVKKGY